MESVLDSGSRRYENKFLHLDGFQRLGAFKVECKQRKFGLELWD